MQDTITTTVQGVSFGLSDGMVFPLTPCCKATGKGGGHGVVCRRCYTDVDYDFGDAALTSNMEEVTRMVRALLRSQAVLHPSQVDGAVAQVLEGLSLAIPA